MLIIKKDIYNKIGFTLIELLIVIAVIAILATVVFVALNPTARFQDSRNSRRWSDVNAILDAVKLSQVDITSYIIQIQNLTADKYYQIGTAGADPNCALTCSNPSVALEASCVDLSELVDRGYLPSLPVDPNGSGAEPQFTHYYIYKSNAGVITIGSCDAEKGSNDSVPAISVSR